MKVFLGHIKTLIGYLTFIVNISLLALSSYVTNTLDQQLILTGDNDLAARMQLIFERTTLTKGVDGQYSSSYLALVRNDDNVPSI